jgi:hypothetical protein
VGPSSLPLSLPITFGGFPWVINSKVRKKGEIPILLPTQLMIKHRVHTTVCSNRIYCCAVAAIQSLSVQQLTAPYPPPHSLMHLDLKIGFPLPVVATFRTMYRWWHCLQTSGIRSTDVHGADQCNSNFELRILPLLFNTTLFLFYPTKHMPFHAVALCVLEKNTTSWLTAKRPQLSGLHHVETPHAPSSTLHSLYTLNWWVVETGRIP